MIGKDVMQRLRGVWWGVWVCLAVVAVLAVPAAQASDAPRMAPAPAWVVADAVPDKVAGTSGLR
ncbi:hypothetical protein Xcc1_27540 [Xanthomonas campestris pv. campestris]|nr:hypothetical protein Xcc1_27540 [Xanthomonas campestris pv. campestris]